MKIGAAEVLRTYTRPDPTRIGLLIHGADSMRVALKRQELIAAVTSTEENEKYLGGSFNAAVTDADYDNVRKMFENVGVTEFTEFVGE